MKIAFFGTKKYFQSEFTEVNEKSGHEITYFQANLDENHVKLAEGYNAICIFVNDICNGKVVEGLAHLGIKLIALRCAGFNNVDLEAAEKFGITVLRVPTYSPHAVAEHTVAMISCLNRHLHKAYAKVRDGNFELDGLLGFDLHNKTVGVIGTGQIGAIFAKIMKLGFESNVIAYDVFQSDLIKSYGIPYVSLEEIFAKLDIISFTLLYFLPPTTQSPWKLFPSSRKV